MARLPRERLEERRDRILRAARACAARVGVQNTTIRGVCEESGISIGGVYVHFASRDALLEGLAEEGRLARHIPFEVLRNTNAGDGVRLLLRRLLEPEGSPDAAPRRIVDIALHAEAVHHDGVRLILLERLEHFLRAAEQVILHWQAGEGGNGIRADVDASVVAELLLAVALGSELMAALRPEYDARAVGEALGALLGAGSGAPRRAEPADPVLDAPPPRARRRQRV